jgi:hypothetical protein
MGHCAWIVAWADSSEVELVYVLVHYGLEIRMNGKKVFVNGTKVDLV